MRTVRLVLCGVLGVLLLAPVAAQAGSPQWALPVRVIPAKPKTTDTIYATFRAGRLKPDERYQVGFGTADNTSCTPGYTVQLRRQRPGRMVRVRFSPNRALASGRVLDEPSPDNGFNTPSVVRFCSGGSDMVVSAVDADGRIRYLGRRAFGVAKDPAYPPLNDTAASITLLEGSSVTVRRAGHPDRTLALAGQLRGTVPGVVPFGRDIAVGRLGGDLSLPVIEPDAECAGSRYRTVFATGPEANLQLKQTGDAIFTLALEGDPASLAGCNVPTSPGRTVVTLTGRAGGGGLSRLAVSGTLPGVALTAGVTGDVTVSLVLKVELGGRA